MEDNNNEEKIYKESLNVNGLEITILSKDNVNDFISLTDLARYKTDEPNDVIRNWMRSKDTLEFLGLWESMHNSNFKPVEFDGFRKQAGSNAFTMSPQKWISNTNAIGIISRPGKNGGTYAHKDIAFEFATWLSPEFHLYVITDYQRLKNDEANKLSVDWNLKRIIAKTNYKIQTDAIKTILIPEDLSTQHKNLIYASEADLINIALFGMTSKEWKQANPKAKGNIRDNATITQLIVLANLENLNANFIKDGLSKEERLLKLNKEAIYQLTTFENNSNIKKLEDNKKLLN